MVERRARVIIYLVLALLPLALFWGGFFGLDLAHRHGYGTAPDGENYLFKWLPHQVAFYGFCGLLGFSCYFATLALRSYSTAIVARLRRVSISKSVLWLSLFAAVMTALFSFGVLRRTPITDDEGAYLFSAKTLATGQLYAPEQPEPRMYDNVFLVNNGRMFSQFTLGHPAMLAPFVKFGAARMLPVILAFCCVAMMFLCARALFGVIEAIAATFLLATSPFFIATGATLLAHLDCLFWLLLFVWTTVELMQDGGKGNAAFAALGFSMAFFVRSASALLIGGPLLILLAAHLLARFRERKAETAVFAGVSALFATLYLGANIELNGSPFRTSYETLWRDRTNGTLLGFGEKIWGIHYTPGRAFSALTQNLTRFALWLHGGPTSLAPLLFWAMSPSKRKIEWALFAPLLLVPGFLFFYFWPGVADTGPVLYYELLLPACLLGGRGLVYLFGRIPKTAPALTLSCLAVSMLAFVPAQAITIYNTATRAGEPERFVSEQIPGKAVVFCSEPIKRSLYNKVTLVDSWRSAHPYNSPDLSDRIIWLHYIKPLYEYDPLVAHRDKYMPDRKAFILSYENGEPVLLSLE